MPDSMFRTPADRETFVDDVLYLLTSRYELPDGTRLEGEAFSALANDLSGRHGWLMVQKGRRWSGTSRYWALDDALREAGFRVLDGNSLRSNFDGTYRRGRSCRFVTV